MRFLILITCLMYQLNAEVISIKNKEAREWDIESVMPKTSSILPIGSFTVEVTSPPMSTKSISLPYSVNLKQLYVSQYDQVKKGQVLAQVTGEEWIKIQQEAIAQNVLFQEHQVTTIRERLLCKEGVIAEKMCLASESKLRILETNLQSSKALLKSFGMSQKQISSLLKNSKILPSLKIVSPSDGIVKMLKVSTGETIDSSETLIVIQQQNELWLESNFEKKFAKMLKKGDMIEVQYEGLQFSSKVLNISSIVNSHNQTQLIRFDVPSDVKLSQGLKSTAEITILKPALKIPKSAVINHESEKKIFIKKDRDFMLMSIDILGEDKSDYYLAKESGIQYPVAITSLAVLKNLIGGSDE